MVKVNVLTTTKLDCTELMRDVIGRASDAFFIALVMVPLNTANPYILTNFMYYHFHYRTYWMQNNLEIIHHYH